MILFVKLLLAHLIGDFLLQPTSWVLDKEIKKYKSIYLYINTFLHGVLAWIFIPKINFIFFAILLAVSHGIICFFKLCFQKPTTKHYWFMIEQILNLIVIILVVKYHNNLIIDFSFFNNQFWISLTAILFLTKPTSILIFNILNLWFSNNEKYKNNSLANAGNYIGILERLLVFCFIATNHFEAIGFLLATKAIFRFGEFKDDAYRELTEYYYIGTLLSFGIALLIGLLYQHLQFLIL